jgi:hypothetical protein
VDGVVLGLYDGREFFEIFYVCRMSLWKPIINTDYVEELNQRLARIEVFSRDGPVVGVSDHVYF